MTENEVKRVKGMNHKITLLEHILMLPIILITTVLPMIIYFKEYSNGLSKYDWFEAVDVSNDFSLYYKHYFYIIFISIMIVIYIGTYAKYKNSDRIPKYYILLGIYLLLALASSIFAINREFSFAGGHSQFESFFAILGYVVTMFYVFRFFNKEKMFRIIFRALSYGIIAIVIYGIFQFTGNDILFSKLGEKLYFPVEYQNGVVKLTNVITDHIALTLYNPNYVGVYTSLLLPIYIIFTVTLKEKKDKILSIVVTIALLFTFYTSRSMAGQLAFGATCIVLLFFVINRKVYINKKGMIGLISAVILLVVVGSIGLVKYMEPRKTIFNLKQIETTDEVIINYNYNKLHVTYEINESNSIGIFIKDSNNENLLVSFDESTYQYTILDERFQGIRVFLSNFDTDFALTVNIDGRDWNFKKLEDNTYNLINVFGRLDKIKTPEVAIFEEHTSLATYRGYIWSRTIPLLKDYLFIGAGPDNFVLTFPHDDYVGLINNKYVAAIVTKPHSLYLQMGVQTGVISLVVYLAFYIIYFILSIKLFINCKFTSYYEKIGLGCFVGTIAYMICSITNDSSIVVAPLFWVIYAIGFKVNTMIRKEREININ